MKKAVRTNLSLCLHLLLQHLQQHERQMHATLQIRQALCTGLVQLERLEREVDYLAEWASESLSDRLLDIKRKFPTVVEYISGPGRMINHLDPEVTKKIVMITIFLEQ